MARKSRVKKAPDTTPSEKKLWKAGLYCRLSVEDDDNAEQNSISNQIKIGLNFLADKADIVLQGTYTDNGYTGMNYDRPDFRRLFADLQSGNINCVLVKDISRLGRNFVLTSSFIERVFPEMGVRLICINDDYDSIDENADTSALMLPLKMVMNDYYVKDISRKIRSSISAKMDSGEYLPSAGSIPYGYIRDKENNTFAVDRKTAHIVLEIFQMRAAGTSYGEICRRLNRDGVPCPGRYRYEQGLTGAEKYKEAVWIRSTVRKITNDRVYTGCRIHGKYGRDKVGLDKKRRPADEWLIIENSHPAIVPLELFNKVEEINALEKEKREKFIQRNGSKEDYRELFRGLVRCAECHSLMTAAKGCARAGSKSPSRIFYDCSTYKKSGHTSCNGHYIREEEIYSTIKNALDGQVKVAVEIEQLIEAVENSPVVARHISSVSNDFDKIAAKRKNLEARTEQLLVDLTNRLIDRDEYEYMKQKYSEQIESLLGEEAKAAASKNQIKTVIANTHEWLDSVKKYKALPELNREILNLLVKEILVFEDKHIKVILNFRDPYKPIMKLLELAEGGLGVG